MPGVGTVASEAAVRTLVLHHLVPAVGVNASTWIDAASQDFDGQIIVGTPLAIIDLPTTSAS